MSSRGLRPDWSPQSRIGEGLTATGRVYQPNSPHKSENKIGQVIVSFSANGNLVLAATNYEATRHLAIIQMNYEQFKAVLAKAEANPTIEQYHLHTTK